MRASGRRPTLRQGESGSASQITEDQLGLDKSQHRDVQRRLTRLGFDVKATGRLDETTRAVITRWQAARGYPKSGYLNVLQKALQSEILAKPRLGGVQRRL